MRGEAGRSRKRADQLLPGRLPKPTSARRHLRTWTSTRRRPNAHPTGTCQKSRSASSRMEASGLQVWNLAAPVLLPIRLVQRAVSVPSLQLSSRERPRCVRTFTPSRQRLAHLTQAASPACRKRPFRSGRGRSPDGIDSVFPEAYAQFNGSHRTLVLVVNFATIYCI